MEIKSSFKAPEGYAYVHKTLRLFGEVIYSTDEVEYQKTDFKLVSQNELQSIIKKWKLGG